MSDFTTHDVMAALSRHIGAANGVTARALVREIVGDATDYHERQLRLLISELREQGAAICATPRRGYFIAQTGDELAECCAFLRSRALHSLRVEAQLRRIPLPTLLGQLTVET